LDKNNPEIYFSFRVLQLFSLKKKVGKKELAPAVEKTAEKSRDPLRA
jgi:hypothetical protein